MKNFKPVRGTHDLIFDEMNKHQYIISMAQKVMELYNVSAISTPIFESTDVFCKSLGDETDIVSKEMYEFKDKGGESLTLRPEGTAPVVRALISNGLTRDTPLKFYYHGPMFRYERPQKGRQRQFHQLGLEIIGVNSYLADIESISLSQVLLKNLNLLSKVQLEINTIGDKASRNSYKKALIDYLTPFEKELSKESQTRLHTNPLRILDSKDEKDKTLLIEAPKLKNCLNKESSEFYHSILEALGLLNIPFIENNKLVRGIDYYDHCVFEWTTQALGAQNAVIAGGRYNSLIASMGGPEIAGLGWGAGLERLVLLLETQFTISRPVVLVPMGNSAEKKMLSLAEELRALGLKVDWTYTGNLAKRMKKADKLKAKFVLILGDNELATNQIQIKNLDTGEQKIVPIETVKKELCE